MKSLTATYKIYLLFLILFSTGIVNAQVQKPVYKSMVANSNAYYEYLPQGYSNESNQKYPVIFFIHGVGNLGNGTTASLPALLEYGPPGLISKGMFPVSFNAKGQTFKFIVISPQFIKWPQPADINGMINYVIKNYRVDTSRLYLTGLSMGGGAAWDYVGHSSVNAKRIAALVPVSGASTANEFKVNNIATSDLPVWATHNLADPTVSSIKTKEYIRLINTHESSSVMAKANIFNVEGHDAWTQTYHPSFKQNGLNIYEWMLQYKKDFSTPAPPVTGSWGKPVKVGLSKSTAGYSDRTWNNWNVAASKVTPTNLKFADGTLSNVKAVISLSETVADNFTNYGYGMAPKEILRYASHASAPRTLTITGLKAGKKYRIDLYASRVANDMSTIFAVNGFSKTIGTRNNFTNLARFDNILPDSKGNIAVLIKSATLYNYLNGFSIIEMGSSTSSFAKTETGSPVNDGVAIADYDTKLATPGQLKVFPNPVQDKFTLHLNHKHTGKVNIQLIDSRGQLKKQWTVAKNDERSQADMYTSELSPGIYILRVQMDSWAASEKIVKM